jgi:hypothetical protein
MTVDARTEAPDWPFLHEQGEEHRSAFGDRLMSNYDHQVDHSVAERLRSGQFLAEYTGWNFHAVCWFADAMFHAEVCVRGIHRLTLSADTPEELMKAVSEVFGDE